MKRMFLSALFCLFGLTACAPKDMVLVDAVDSRKFVALSRSMRPAMLNRHFVDSHGDWYSPRFPSRPESAGKILAERLSPTFLPAYAEEEPTTFPEAMRKGVRITEEPYRSTLRKGADTITLELVAIADWDGNGRDDWLVSCQTASADSPVDWHEYVLLVTDVDAPRLQPRLLLEQVQQNGKLTVLAEPFYGELVEAGIEHYVQGQIDVTQAPDQKGWKASQDDGAVKQSALSM